MWPATLLVLLSGMFARGVTNEQKGYPLRPRQFKVLSAGRGLWMTWSPPRLTAERPVTSYRLSYGQNLHQLKSVALPASVRSYLIRDVDRADFGFPYFVLLRAENRRGLSQPVYRVEIPSRGAWVSPVPHDPTYSGLITAKITEIGAPRPPRVVKVHTGSNWSQLNWQRPFSGSETDWRRVRGYFVGFGIPGHPMRFEHLPGHRFSHKVDGLDPESVQVFSVQALNVLGASVPMFRAAHTKRDPTVKGELLVPKKVLVTVVSPEEATITWQTIGLPPNKGSTREYRVRYRRKKNNDRYQYKVTRETELTISNLAPGTTYKLSVRVAQGNRVGRWSHDVLFTTHPGDDGTTGLDSMDDGVAPGSRKRPQSDGEGRQNLSIPRIITADSGVEVKTQPPPTEAATVRLKKTFTPERPESNPSPTPASKTRPTSPQPELTAVAPRGETSPFHATPSSPLDLAGKERYIAPHVNYLSKDPNEPCSLSEALDHFQVSELTDLIPQELQRSTGPPENPPSNLTVVAVEGCHSFVILDWGKLQGDGDNMVTGYLVYSASYDNILQNKWTKKSVGNSFVPIENLNPNTRYYFKVRAKNQKGMGPLSLPLKFRTESNDPLLVIRPHGGEPIWIPFKFKYNRADSLCRGRQYVKRTWYQKFVGVVLCNSLRYKILLGDKLNETFHSIGDGVGRCEDHCQFVDSFMEARTGLLAPRHQLRVIPGYYRDYRQQRVKFGRIGRGRQGRYTMYVGWYECGITIPGSL
uniref:target of Nesh-SH3-like isoform X2 n=1 Tax=Myxine glutinosa TaxID=7769 RepID=UPI00358E9A10